MAETLKALSINYIMDPVRNFFSPRRSRLAEFRLSWGQVNPKHVAFLEHYYKLTATDSAEIFVDKNTWINLELPKVFSELDTTVTPLGSQYLYKQLHTYIDNEKELSENYRRSDEFRKNQSLREDVQMQLAYLSEESASMVGLIFGEQVKLPSYYQLIVTWVLVLFAIPIGIFAFGLHPLVWILALIANFILVAVLPLKTHYNQAAFHHCYRMLRIADSLEGLKSDLPEMEKYKKRLMEEGPGRKKAQKALSFFSYPNDSGKMDGLLTVLNLIFHTESLMYILTVNRFNKVRQELAATFKHIGQVDAAIAIASFLQRNPEHCQPELSGVSKLDIEGAYHPLLENPVKNSVKLDEKSMLITGSNMAGKTTYIKTVGINIVFGRTLGFCFATRALISNSSVMASIRSEHSIESGKSQYYIEIENILAFIENAKRGSCKIFLIDELFSGTNTIERIAAARAVLEYLSKDSQVFVTTHDVELQQLLNERFTLFHFQEDPDVEGFFDYRLRAGEATRRNAIQLLARLGFPDELVKTALSYALSADGQSQEQN